MSSKQPKRTFKRFESKKRDTSKMADPYFVPQPLGDVSQCYPFWNNYNISVGWQERHQIAYWKSRAKALEYENKILHEQLNMYACNKGKSSLSFLTPKETRKIDAEFNKYAHSSNRNAEDSGMVQHFEVANEEIDEEVLDFVSSDEEPEFEFQITEEMMDFFEQSIKHKEELRKEREKEALKKEKSEEAAYLPPKEQVGVQRTKEMHLLYGKAAPMILGMETAMQLSFDRNCDLKQPKLWPNIPLNL